MGLIGSGRRRLLESLTASLVTLLLILAAGVQHRIRDVDTSWSAQTRPAFAAEGDPFVWAVGGAGPDEARHLAVDGAGNVYLAGMFSATIDADPGQSTVSLTSADSTDIFLAKYGSGGEVVWAFGVGGTGNDQVYQVSLDPFGKVYLAGSFADEVDFAPGDAVAAVRAGGERDGFVAKFGPAGELLWVTPLNPLGDDAVLALALDGAGNAVAAGLAGNVLLTGTFDGVLDVSGDGAMSLETRGQGDLFVASFAPDGALRWASGIGGPDLDGGMRVAADAAGYVYVAGWSSGDLPLQQGSAPEL